MTGAADLQSLCESWVRAAWADRPDSAHDLGHLRRVWAMCRRLAAAEPGADPEVLLPAAFLHDLVNLPKDHPDRARASALSADQAAGLLATTAYPAAKIASVAHAIAAHSFSAGIAPQTVEARILQDADRLDALGALGLARMFAVSGALGRALVDAGDPLAEARALDDRRFALDHLETKLFRLPGAMHTQLARTIAARRVALMQDFRDRMLAEMNGQA